jgi:ribosomal protein L44E
MTSKRKGKKTGKPTTKSAAKPTKAKSIKVSCEECRKHIPRSVATSTEGGEYIKYFCGLECYEVWFNEKRAQTKSERRKRARRTGESKGAKSRVGLPDKRKKLATGKLFDRRKKLRR